MSIYTGYFNDINNNAYRVIFNCSKGSEAKEITLGGSPFTTQMEGDDDTIYNPVKYQGATVEIIDSDYLFDLYSGKAQATSVTLDKMVNNKWITEWMGFVEPNLYSQGFEEQREVIEVNCIDGLSTLQYFKYETEDINSNIYFNQLISKLLSRCNCYQYFYISTNTSLTKEETGSLIDKILINQRAFYSERNDATETDEDLALTMQDVLEAVCQYLGVTAISDGDSVYFIDYDALKAGNFNFYRYFVISGGYVSTVTLKDTYKITGEDYSENGATLSLDTVYNKVVVTDRFKDIDEIDIDFFDLATAENITANNDTNYQSINTAYDASDRTLTSALAVVDEMILDKDEQEPTRVERLFDLAYNISDGKVNKPNFVAARYLKHPNANLKKYSINNYNLQNSVKSFVQQTYPDTINYYDSLNLIGSYLAQIYSFECPYQWRKELNIIKVNGEEVTVDKDDDLDAMTFQAKWTDGTTKYNAADAMREEGDYQFLRTSKWHNIADYRQQQTLLAAHEDISARGLIPQIKLDNYIVLSVPYMYSMYLDQDQFDKVPFFSINSTALDQGMIGGKDTYLIISGNIHWNTDKDRKGVAQYGQGYPIPKGQRGIKTEQYIKSQFETYLNCWLRYNGYSWNGREWVKDDNGDVYFKLYYMNSGCTDDDRKVSNTICTDLPIRNNIDYTMGLNDKTGTAIPIPPEWGILTKSPAFGICKPHFPALNKYDSGNFYETYWYPNRVFIKDLKLEFAMGNGNKVNLESDTAYSNTIDDGNVAELSDIEFKITTYDDKKLSYTNVCYYDKDADKYHFLQRVYNRALYDKELDYFINNGDYSDSELGLKQEEHTVFKIVNQYTQPAVKLNLTLKNRFKVYGLYQNTTMAGKDFIVQSVSTDYRMNSQNINLIEKF